MKSTVNYRVGVKGVDPTGGTITLRLQVNQVTIPVVTPADLKFNKDIAMSVGFDDALISQYRHLPALFTGGVSALNGLTYPGLYYSDGTGKMIHFVANMVIPPGGVREDPNESNPASYSWQACRELLALGFGFNNHSYYHGGGETPWDRADTIRKGDQIMYDRMGYRPLIGTAPASENGYIRTFDILGYWAHNSNTDGEDYYQVYTNCPVQVVPKTYFQYGRDYQGDAFDENTMIETRRFIQEIYDAADKTKMVANMLTHGPGDVTNFSLAYTELLNHPKNTDKNRLWVPSVQELLEYFHVKDHTTIAKTLIGNELTVTLDQAQVHSNVRNRGMSLLLSGLNVTAINGFEGADEVTFNPATGLINVYKIDASKTIDPSTEIQPPKMLTLKASGNSVICTYNKPISQSAAVGYKLSEKNLTATSVRGSGTTWTVTFPGAIVAGDTLTYSARYGDAIALEAGGKKLTDYLLFPIPL